MPALFVAIPLGVAFLTSLVGKYTKTLPDILAQAAGIVNVILSCTLTVLLSRVPSGVIVYKVGGWDAPFGINLVVDGLTVFMLVTINLVACIIALFCINYMEKYTSKWKFYTLFLLMLAGMNGVVLSGDIFNLFVFLEIASVASFGLVAYGVEAEELEATFKYIVMSGVASLFILLGIAFLYSYTSTLTMADIAASLQGKGVNNVVIFVSVLFIMGFGLKAAIVPFHSWLPDAHPSAPAPVSALLSGLLIKTLGIYALLRIFYNILGLDQMLLNIFMFLGGLSIIIGALLALGQRDFKRLLAYSSINQIGYILLAIGLHSPLGLLGGLFHLFNHSFFKSLLFLNSGAVEYATGTRDLEEMGGLRQRMPVTANTSLIGSMAISGIPPFNGFFSKIIIIVACIQEGHIGYGLVAVAGSILTLAYFAKLQKYAFLGKLKEKYSQLKEVPFFMQCSMLILACICLMGGLVMIPAIKNYFLQPAVDALMRGLDYKNLILAVVP